MASCYSTPQVYRGDSSSSLPEPPSQGSSVDVQVEGEDSKAFGEKRETLVSAIDAATDLLSSLQNFNTEHWTIRYPHQLGLTTNGSGGLASTPTALVRSRTGFPEDSTPLHDEKRPIHGRNLSADDGDLAKSSSSSSVKTPSSATPHPLSILAPDLKLSHPSTSSTPSLPALLPSLSLSTLSQLLSRRITSSQSHLGVLRNRVLDTSSRILVTGDLNAGKSTFVNALLRREVMPTDQQPCTEVFCEVLDAQQYNRGIEEVHAIRHGEVDKYDSLDPDTFENFALEQLEKVAQIEPSPDMDDDEDADPPQSPYQIVKVYVNDVRQTTREIEENGNPSFIRNGLVSISLIDAPGLNRDTLSTTALFARQSEIDVIVFVVSAENHFTLSAKEFLWNASREKAYVFVVVNKYANIRDKARCRRLVGDQIKQLSPATWENRHELVHFVESSNVLVNALKAAHVEEEGGTSDTSFNHLEQSLKSFVLLKRSQSKLAPAKHYLLNLLSDLSTLADANFDAAEAELEVAASELARIAPEHAKLTKSKDHVEDGIAKVEEDTVGQVSLDVIKRLDRAVAMISEGKTANIPGDTGADFVTPSALPPYPGFMDLWCWASDVKDTLVQSLEGQVRAAEETARNKTTIGVKDIMVDLGNQHLPDSEKGKNERVFRPEVMFAKRRKAQQQVAGGGISSGGLGLGLGQTRNIDVSMLDLVDLDKIFAWHHSSAADPKQDKSDEAGTLSVVSLGVGAVTMFGSRAVGVKGFVEALAKCCEVLGSKQARSWMGPVVGVATLGLVVYVVVDIPRAVPRNIGRKLQASLASEEVSQADIPTSSSSFSDVHAERITKETRKVLRLAGWDLRERFRTALEKSEKEKLDVETRKKQAESALEWLGNFVRSVDTVDQQVDEVDLDGGHKTLV